MAVIKLLQRNWLIVLIIVMATFLRTWKLHTHGILFSDAGRDLLAAQTAVTAKELPLLGIPSSVPRFHQGPLTVWLHMIIYVIVGNQTLVYSLVFALISVLAVIFTYEFAVLHLSKPAALVAATLLAVSPLAVAHGRVPYHITPIPLVLLIFLFAMMKLWHKQKNALFWAVLSWALLMQFELALFGLSLIVVYILWKRRFKLNKEFVSELTAAGMLGFVPQIVHDLRHPFSQSQLTAFFAWVGYRVISLTGLTGKNQFGLHALKNAFNAFMMYGQRIFSTDLWPISIVALALLLFSCFLVFKHYKNKQLPVAMEIISLTTIILTISYVAHGGPSEAYFPPYFILFSLLLGYGLTELLAKRHRLLFGGLAVYALISIVSIFRYNFFVSNSYEFNYGPSIAEQRNILATANQLSGGRFYLSTTDDGRKFSAYLDNYRWLAKEHLYAIDPRGVLFFINLKDSPLKGYPGVSRVEFASRDLYVY